eukprot:2529770-Prymnesium_polylepis.2
MLAVEALPKRGERVLVVFSKGVEAVVAGAQDAHEARTRDLLHLTRGAAQQAAFERGAAYFIQLEGIRCRKAEHVRMAGLRDDDTLRATHVGDGNDLRQTAERPKVRHVLLLRLDHFIIGQVLRWPLDAQYPSIV